MGKNSHNPRGLSGKAKIKIFVVYFVLFSMLATLACFMVEELISSYRARNPSGSQPCSSGACHRDSCPQGNQGQR